MIKISTFGPQRPHPAISVILFYPASEGLKKLNQATGIAKAHRRCKFNYVYCLTPHSRIFHS
jgi:hypothetical protein